MTHTNLRTHFTTHISQPHSRRHRTVRGALGRLAFYPLVAWCAVFSFAGFVAPETIDGRGADELPVVIDAGGAR